MSAKEAAVEMINQFPDDLSVEEIGRRLEFIAGVEAGIESCKSGKGYTLEEMRQRIVEWTSQPTDL